MSFYFAQFLTGLSSASSLFLVASGLSLIFGVSRVVNFAHGSFYMLGAYVVTPIDELTQHIPKLSTIDRLMYQIQLGVKGFKQMDDPNNMYAHCLCNINK